MTRVLVTGAGGFIAGRVLRMVPPSWDVVALSRREAPGPTSARWVTLTADGRVPDAVAGERFDTVIHLAGNADHALAVREPWRDLEATGVVGARLLASIEARRIVLLSSAAVYAGLDGAVGPDMDVRPTMPYALSKLYLEGFVRSRVAADAADGAAIIRLYNAFGPGEKPTRLVPRVVAAMRDGTHFRLAAAPDSLSDPVHVDDVATTLAAAADASVSGTWDLCGGDPRTLPEQVARIARSLGATPPPIDLEPDASQTPIRFHSDPRPLARALGIGTPRRFEDGVQAYAREEGWVLDRR